MKVAIFGATGMVGKAALYACLADARVSSVLAVGRSATGHGNLKLEEKVLPDVSDLGSLRDEFRSVDACLFCLGVSSAGKSEEEYSRVTYELTVNVAEQLAAANPEMTFVYVSGQGTDSSETGRSMWARVKGKTENHLLAMPFRAAYMFRPGFIQPMDGIRSKTRLYQAVYSVTRFLGPLLRKLFPSSVTTTRELGRSMVEVAVNGYSKRVIEGRDINEIAATG